MAEPPEPRIVFGDGAWEGWVFVWHDVEGRLHESRFRRAELPGLVEKLLGIAWGGQP